MLLDMQLCNYACGRLLEPLNGQEQVAESESGDHKMETGDQPKELSKSQLKKLQQKWRGKRKLKRLRSKKRKSPTKW